MSTIEEAIFSKLSGTTAISNLVGRRIYPMRMPDSAIENGLLPCITYQRIATIRDNTMGGPQSLAQSTFTVECWGAPSASILTVKAIARAVQAALSGFSGSILGIDVQGVLAQNESDQYEEEVNLYRTSQDYLIFHVE